MMATHSYRLHLSVVTSAQVQLQLMLPSIMTGWLSLLVPTASQLGSALLSVIGSESLPGAQFQDVRPAFEQPTALRHPVSQPGTHPQDASPVSKEQVAFRGLVSQPAFASPTSACQPQYVSNDGEGSKQQAAFGTPVSQPAYDSPPLLLCQPQDAALGLVLQSESSSNCSAWVAESMASTSSDSSSGTEQGDTRHQVLASNSQWSSQQPDSVSRIAQLFMVRQTARVVLQVCC